MLSPLSRLPSLDDLSELFLEEFFNRQNTVTKVAPVGVLTGMAYGIARLAQRVLVQTAVGESRYLLDQAHGEYLDYLATLEGVGSRLGALAATTYVRLTGAPGTFYPAGTQVLGSAGVTFTLERDVTVGAAGYAYESVRSLTTGARTNVAPLTLTSLSPQPSGHLACVNEYQATGGRDTEDDDTFRRRLIDGPNVLARNTLSMAEQLLLAQDARILRLHFRGIGADGRVILTVATQNAQLLTNEELAAAADFLTPYLSFRDQRPTGFPGAGVRLENAPDFPLDISQRVDLAAGADPDAVRRAIQQRIARYLDHRTWETGMRVEWEELLQIVRTTPGVSYCYDQHFSPREDLIVPIGALPRVRAFLLLNAQGQVMAGGDGALSPVFYPAVADFALQRAVLA